MLIRIGQLRNGLSERKGRRRLTCHTGNRHGCPPGQDPPQTFDLALAIAVERNRDFVIELLDGAFTGLLLHAHVHTAVIKHSAQIVFEGQGFLGRFLG